MTSDETPSANPTEPGPSESASSEPSRPEITIDEFARVELRVAKVLEAELHPKADRLLRLQIDVGGGERRQLVAGIAAAYRPEDLIGRNIVIVANLKPAKLRGELSQGMLLAASYGDVVSLLQPDQDLPPGATIR